ncbi:GntR family transcriptional regulator [Gordonia sp. PP30]|uniref:GntR family transcriptional regulator n=1 Tax=Gordonia sp. PP30 TaxID=2935861 RepID=UPI001FFF4B0F|nr:GntR family transcriptional regulator [Gordonia sp. PP30]UQE75474.1 GntR family transcriptional regulator [Gordonia sp. PP30]
MSSTTPRGVAGLEPVANPTRRDAVINEIKRGIVLGTIRPGERLTESSLSEALRVSRPTVREALNWIAQEGLLVQQPYRGLRVAELDPREILDVAHVRVALDMQAMTEVLADESGAKMAAIRRAWEEYRPLADDRDPMVQHESHVAFHRRIWEAAGNTFLMNLWPATEAHITICLARDQAARHDPERAPRAHRALMDAFETGDLETVHAALVVHIIDSAEQLVALIEQRESGA